jgi:hypothetical protein
MIFSRRALQRRLNGLRAMLGDPVSDKLVARLNQPGRDRIAAMWEVVVLHALAPLGTLTSEVPLASGRRPDITFASVGVSFTADVTAISDEGLDELNPVNFFATEIEKLKTRLKLPVGGLNLSVRERTVVSNRGRRRVLQLPPRRAIPNFIKAKIEPVLRNQISEGQEVLHLDYQDAEIGFNLVIDPKRTPYSTFSYGAYDLPTIPDNNPLYNALKAKAGQLRTAQGLTGIIVGDGDAKAIASLRPDWSTVSTKAIVDEFFRQFSSVGFVALLTVHEDGGSTFQRRHRRVHVELWTKSGLHAAPSLKDLFRQVVVAMPRPANSAVNGAYRARESGYYLGFHGGGTLSAKRIKISAREVMEVLAGRRTVGQMNEMHDWHLAKDSNRTGTFQNVFERWLTEGRLPTSISIVPGGEDEADDWIEIEVGAPDPAVSPFK